VSTEQESTGGSLKALQFVRSGGYAGIERRCHLSAESLGPEEFANLDRLVSSALPLRRAADRRAPLVHGEHDYLYSLVMVRDNGTDKFVLTHADLDANATSLLRYLDLRAKPAF
jgi:hypothetical protein